MNEQQRAERRLKLMEDKVDKISEIVILLCKIRTQTKVSDITQRSHLSNLERLSEGLAMLQRRR